MFLLLLLKYFDFTICPAAGSGCYGSREPASTRFLPPESEKESNFVLDPDAPQPHPSPHLLSSPLQPPRQLSKQLSLPLSTERGMRLISFHSATHPTPTATPTPRKNTKQNHISKPCAGFTGLALPGSGRS